MSKKDFEVLFELLTKFMTYLKKEENHIYIYTLLLVPMSIIEYQLSNYEKLYGENK